MIPRSIAWASLAVARAHASADYSDALRRNAERTPALITRPIKTEHGTIYMVSVAGDGAPKDLLARSTVDGALADGAIYVARHWGQRRDGTWTPYPSEWK
jgi:hypothetical protein